MAEARRAGRKAAHPAPGIAYEKRPGHRAWTRPGFEGIAYSDGQGAEAELLEALKRATDLSSASDELAHEIADWMREAHLSPARANLLRPLEFSGVRSVLELGAGCGPITRYLGELGLEVDAVEGNPLRAECAAERCRDLPNVTVFADDLASFVPRRKYDVVTLIGVLEYSRVFLPGEDPVAACLAIARSHLAEGGALVLAIENQLGLKYFNGSAEDHLGTAYSGITDLYGAKTAVTFGRHELEVRLRDAGFDALQWAYPFPDYKLPTTVISARGLETAGFSAGDLLLGEFARDYAGGHLRSFDEPAVWPVLERNGLMGEFANSFLVVAARGPKPLLDDGGWLASRYSPHRLRRFATETRFLKASGAVAVAKNALVPAEKDRTGVDGELRLTQRLDVQPYTMGRLFARDFFDAVARGYAVADLAQFLRPWVDFLRARCEGPTGADVASLRLPGQYLDCIPTNLIVDGNGALHPIDLEFVAEGSIPVAWVVLRGTVHLASKAFGHREVGHQSFRDFLEAIMPALGFGAISDWTPYCELEDSLIRLVLRPWKNRPRNGIFAQRLQLPVASYRSLPEAYRAALAHSAGGGEGALAEKFRHWLATMPDPLAGEEAAALVPAFAEATEQFAASVAHNLGPELEQRVRELGAQRGHWIAVGRDNARLAWELNEVRSENEQLKAAGEAARPGQAFAPNDPALGALRESLETLRREAAERQAALEEASLRGQQLALAQTRAEGHAQALESEIAALRKQLEAAHAASVDHRVRLEGAINRLRRRGAETARAHARLREAQGQVLEARAEINRVMGSGSWRFTRIFRDFYERHPWPWDTLTGRRQPALDPAEEARLATRAERVALSQLFDAANYLRENPDLGIAREAALRHYLAKGWRQGRRPNALFHEAWYRERNAATLQPDESGLEHYLRFGASAGAWPNPVFDAAWYLSENSDVHAHTPGPLHHYMLHGALEGRDPHPLFDTDWFLVEYADAAALALAVNPLAYFLDEGATTGHSPCELFDAEWYLSQNPDVDAAGTNPLVHYLDYGWKEGRDPSPDFSVRWYLENNPDVAAAGGDPLLHYRLAGRSEGRLPAPRPASVASPIGQLPGTLAPGDGVQEWKDYAPLKQRVSAEAAQELAAVVARPPPLLQVGEEDVEATIAGLAFPRHEHPAVSIVLPVFENLALTLECLRSIAAARTEVAYEIIVTDDASRDGTAARLAGVPGLVVRGNEENLGFLRNCNAAFPLARGEFTLMLNNDVQVTDGWLDALVGTYDTFAAVGAVGPKLVYPSGHLQEAGARLCEDGSAEMVGLNDDPSRERYNYARPVDYVSGACLLLRTSLLRELGGFAESFAPCYCEDSDLCMRIRARGLRILYQPAATVVHHLSRTTASTVSDVKARHVAASLGTFVDTWQEELERLNRVRVLAFYLPQFHPIPENDLWWGTGFTEWTNVTRARPNFVGHYQPRLPADLGYYDLRVPEVMHAQAELARRYGLHGFCFYYYWFAGKRLLEGPVERMLTGGAPDIPYCLCWANENWTRRWDGADHDILVAQRYSPEDDEAVILDMIRHFRAGNYIRVDGRPLLLVYRVSMFPDFRATAERWRATCRREGVGEIYLALVESFDLVHAGAHPGDFNCDASVEFPPLGMAQTRPPSGPVINPEFVGQVADYRDIAARFCARPVPGHTRLRGVMPGWDNTARRQNNSFCFENATPGAFQAWLETVIDQTRAQHHGDERIVFLNAWNEWAEGAYLEPDQRYGHAFLEAVRNALEAQSLLRLNRYALDL